MKLCSNCKHQAKSHSVDKEGRFVCSGGRKNGKCACLEYKVVAQEAVGPVIPRSDVPSATPVTPPKT